MNLTMNMNQAEGSVSAAKTSDIQFEGSDPATNRDFKQTFCGVLVGLIFAIVAVVFFVSLQMISGTR